MITLKLNDELMSFTVKQDSNFNEGGEQTLLEFPNGYGASIIKHQFSYGGERGKFELAVIVWSDTEYYLTYDTPITDDVIGYLDNADIPDILYAIKALPTATLLCQRLLWSAGSTLLLKAPAALMQGGGPKVKGER